SRPDYIRDTMAFMFESRYVICPTRYALESPQLQAGYYQCWQNLGRRFTPDRR
ncbi:MAG: homogentisate 1,2-dioxygenase, partial [Pseudomonadota bacterium]|nr:homogentisate 1,2-dioxygenase [Pseudomonadota bacterium]